MPSINIKLLNQTKVNSINNRVCLKSTICITGGKHDYPPPAQKKKSTFRHRAAVPQADTLTVRFVF